MIIFATSHFRIVSNGPRTVWRCGAERVKREANLIVMRKILVLISLALSGLQVTFGQIIIANTYVVNTNTYDTIVGEYISGLVTYNPETRTLTLENATIVEPTPQSTESSDGVLVFAGTYSNRLDTVSVKLLGENVIVAHSPLGRGITGYYCTQINILGSGSLTVVGFPGISLDYVQELTIQEGASVRFPQPTATGFDYVGIASHYERTPVRIDSSTFICETGIPFNNIADLHLSRCHVSVPENAYFDEPTGTMLNANGIAVNSYFEIVPGSGTAIPQYSDENSVTLYPNPANEFVNVQCTMNDVQWDGATAEVFDVYGKRLQTVRVSTEITTLDVSGLADGVYFVRVKNGVDIVSKPFVKK